MNEPTTTITGNLTAKPELRSTNDGAPVTDLRVAVNIRRRNAQEEWVDVETLWYEVSVWRGAAENVVEQLDQGARVTVVGRVTEVRAYQTQDGRLGTVTKVSADHVGVSLDIRARKPLQSV